MALASLSLPGGHVGFDAEGTAMVPVSAGESKLGESKIKWSLDTFKETFEEIKEKSNKVESEVIKIMRSNLKPSSFKLWRKRVNEKSIKHRKLFEYSRKSFKKFNLNEKY